MSTYTLIRGQVEGILECNQMPNPTCARIRTAAGQAPKNSNALPRISTGHHWASLGITGHHWGPLGTAGTTAAAWPWPW